MPFWKVSRATGGQLTAGSAARDLAPHLEPISVFTTKGTFEGWIVAAEQRVTDVLNEHPHLRICLELTPTSGRPSTERTSCSLPHPNPQRRISRRKNRLVALVASYVVTGTAHIQPGTTLDPYLLRRQVRFLPLTDAWVTNRIDPTVELSRPVLIVNTMNLVELRSAMTVVSAPGVES